MHPRVPRVLADGEYRLFQIAEGTIDCKTKKCFKMANDFVPDPTPTFPFLG